MLRFRFLIVTLMVIVFSLTASAQQSIYYTSVTMPVVNITDYYKLMDPKIIAEDMSNLLTLATGESYIAKAYDGKTKDGIFLLLDSNLVLSSNESAVLHSDGKNRLVIKARYIAGLSYGVYTYLDKLGFKFYLPGAAWTILPNKPKVYLPLLKDQEWKPFFKNREFAFSGALPPIEGVDEKNINKQIWLTWYRRNKMGSDHLGIDGHIGELFNMENRSAIEKDPAILAPVEDKRRYNDFGKLDPTYEKGVNMFIDWAIEKYRVENANRPFFFPAHRFQTVDPGDALNYCHTPECEVKFKTVSNQVFYVANQAAKRIRSKFPDAGVSLYAYSERADTPDFKLEPNVHVGVVSTGFQNVDLPVNLVNRWVKKTTHLTLYDYLNIGSGLLEEPFFNLTQYIDYLKMARAAKVDGFTFEAAPSKFSSGIQQYFILKYLCTPYDNINKEFDEFCNLSFTKSTAPIKALFRDWYFSDVHLATTYDGRTFEDYELGRFANYLSNAEGVASNQDVKTRIDEIKAYVVLLGKKYDVFNNLKISAANQKDKTIKNRLVEDMLEYSWKLYNRNIFHNTEFNQTIKGLLGNDTAAYNRWNYGGLHIRQIKKETGDLVEREFTKFKERFVPRALAAHSLDDAFLTATSKLSADSIKISMIDVEYSSAYFYYLDLYCPSPSTITINVQAGSPLLKKTVGNRKGLCAIFNDRYSYVENRIISLNDTMLQTSFFIPKKGHYKVALGQQNSTPVTFVIKPGKNLLYVNKTVIPMNFVLLQEGATSNYANKYLAFYVPNVDSFSYKLLYPDCANTTSLYNSKGQQVKTNVSDSPFYISYKTTAADRNGFMFYSNSFFRWPPNMKNVAPYYFFLKFPVSN